MRQGDVWGAILADVLAGRRAMEIVERDDGYMMAFDAENLVAPFSHWDDLVERRAMRFVRGRVLDVGCGAGRVCLHLQEPGLEVVGIDTSPGSIKCCRQRGVHDARVLALDHVRRGRMPGQLRVRVRYRDLATRWIDWLQVSPAELEDLVEGTGWRLSRMLGDDASYVAILDRT